MPEVIHGNVGCQAFAIGPWEIATVLGEMDGLCLGTGCRSKPWADFEWTDNSERRSSVGRGHRRSQVFRNGSAIADIGQHHGFLHRPRIVAIHKSEEAIVAIRGPGCMACINRLALHKESIMG